MESGFSAIIGICCLTVVRKSKWPSVDRDRDVLSDGHDVDAMAVTG
jgi:hypothetical protein